MPEYKNIPLNKERFLFIINKVFFGIQLIKYLLDNFVAVHEPINIVYMTDQIQKAISLNSFSSMHLIRYK